MVRNPTLAWKSLLSSSELAVIYPEGFCSVGTVLMSDRVWSLEVYEMRSTFLEAVSPMIRQIVLVGNEMRRPLEP